MNSTQAVERALRLVTPQPRVADLPSLYAAILTNIPLALEVTARRIAGDPKRRDLLRRDAPTAVSVSAGLADLSTTLSIDKVLLDFIETAEIRLDPDSSNLGPFHWVTERAQLFFKRSTDTMFISCALSGSTLYTRNTDGALDAELGPIAIEANYIPTLDQLPFALNAEFLDTLARTAPLEKIRNGQK